jgi:hypothetical protein
MNKYILTLIIFSLCSCSSTLLVNVSYEESKLKIAQYFKARTNSGIKPNDPKVNRIYGARFNENKGLTNSQWGLNLGSRFSKRDALLPNILTLTLKKRQAKSKIYIDVMQHGLFFSERKREQERAWIRRIKQLLEKK